MNNLIHRIKGPRGYLAGADESELSSTSNVSESPDGLWGFLRDKSNQQLLGWIGGGLVVAATGLWAVFVYFFPPGKSPDAKAPQPTAPSVQANCGGIAIGRDVTGSTITA